MANNLRSATRFWTLPLRHAAPVLAGAVLLAQAAGPAGAQVVPPAAPCNHISGAGTIVTCTGNLSAGVLLNNGSGPVTTLDVLGLTSNIAPASGVNGVFFGSTVPVNLYVDTGPWSIVTTGDDAAGVLAGTIGAGDIDITVAGAIRTSGSLAAGISGVSISGDLSIASFASIVTTGAGSSGIRGSSGSGSVGIWSAGTITTTQDLSDGIFATAAGDVLVASFGKITVDGEGAHGIFAESTTGSVIIELAGDISTAGVDGAGIFIETGGVAIVESSGNIRTQGDSAAGISAGGEGGVLIASMGNITTSGADAPGITVISEGDVVVASMGNITTTGEASDGISAISLSGMAAVANVGNVSATGIGSAGIYVRGEDGALLVNGGRVVGGPCCAAVMMMTMGDGILLNLGEILADEAGDAIVVAGASSLAENYGRVAGNVLMLGGSSEFYNFGLFESGVEVEAESVINDGTLSPGGRGTVITTELTGALTQNTGGIYAVDVDDAGGTSDQILVSEAADLAGKVAVRLVTLPALGAQTFTILSADNGAIDSGLGLIASPALHAWLSFPNANDVVLGMSVDFTVAGLNSNQVAIAENLDAVLQGGAGGVTPVLLGLLNTTDLAAFRNALDQLSPQIYSNAEIASLYANLAFTGSLMSCKVNGTDTASIIREGQCLWAGASARFLDTGTSSDQIGYTEQAGLFTAGAQVALDEVWRLGVAGGFQSSSLSTPTGASSDGAIGQAGLALKYNPGQLLVAGALTGGGGTYDTSRPMAFGGFNGLAEGDQDLGFFSAALRAAYVFGQPDFYAKPVLDASLTHLRLGSMTESGGNGAALNVEGTGHTVFAITPTIEIGTEWWLANGTLIRPMLRGGAVWYSGDDLAMTASFVDAPAGVGPFSISTDLDQTMGVVGAGIEVINGADAVFRLSYDGQFGSSTQIHAVGVRGSSRF